MSDLALTWLSCHLCITDDVAWETNQVTLTVRSCSGLLVMPPALHWHWILTSLLSLIAGLALDWVSRHLYFTNMGYSEPGLDGAVYSWHRVEMISLHKAQRKTVVTDVERPRGLDIDINNGWIIETSFGGVFMFVFCVFHFLVCLLLFQSSKPASWLSSCRRC